MKKIFFILLCSPFLLFSQTPWKQLGVDIDGELAGDQSGYSVSIDSTGNRIAIGAPFNDGNGNVSGHVRVYEHNGVAWVQLGADIDGETVDDESGTAVSINAAGDRVAIGAPFGRGTLSGMTGHVRVFEYNGASWTQLGGDINGELGFDHFGSAVALNATGDRVVIGAPNNDGNGSSSGHARVFEYNGTSWVQLGADIDGEAMFDASGDAVAINAAGDRIAVGAPGNTSDRGHIRVFEYNGASWVQQGVDIDGERTGDQSGSAISMNDAGDRVAIGAPLNRGGTHGFGTFTGHVRVYDYVSTSWVQVGGDIDGVVARDKAGSSVSLNGSGDRLAIGAPFNDEGIIFNIGNVRVFDYDGTSWSQFGMDIDGEAMDDVSGSTVAINWAGDRIGIGAPANDASGINAGHVRIYDECPIVYGNDIQNACNSFTWIDGNTYISDNSTATHVLSGAAANGCDSVVTLDLTVNFSSTSTDTHVECDSLTWIDGNTYYSNNSTATHTITAGSANGCDSMITLNLTINRSTSVDTHTSCGSFTWIDGNTYTSSNSTAIHTLTNAAGCDSIVTLNLTVNSSSLGIDSHVACDSLTWIDGNTYYTNNSSATHTLTNAAGCDSLVLLDLIVNYSSSNIDTQIACDSLTWVDGNTYYSDNSTATHLLTSSTGCDSLVTLNLSVNRSSLGVDTQIVCDSLTWIDGNTYFSNNTAATYVLIGAAVNGCDSTVTLDLTINTIDKSVTSNGAIITASESGATYQWLDCLDNFSPISGATSQSFSATINGDYAVEISQNGCIDTSECVTISTVGKQEYLLSNEISIFPNPSAHQLTILGINKKILKIEILDPTSKTYPIELYRNNTLEIGQLAKGMYFLKIYTPEGAVTKKFIKK